MRWIGYVRCEKFWCDFMTRISALIVPVKPFLHRVSCSYKTFPITPKYYEPHHNMSLGSNGVDRVHSLRKIPMRLRGKNFCINCTSSARFAPSSSINETIQNAHKHYETQQYMSLGSNRVGRVHSLRKIPNRIHGTNFCINCTSSSCFAPSFVH